jgi:hypothetical protein
VNRLDATLSHGQHGFSPTGFIFFHFQVITCTGKPSSGVATAESAPVWVRSPRPGVDNRSLQSRHGRSSGRSKSSGHLAPMRSRPVEVHPRRCRACGSSCRPATPQWECSHGHRLWQCADQFLAEGRRFKTVLQGTAGLASLHLVSAQGLTVLRGM